MTDIRIHYDDDAHTQVTKYAWPGGYRVWYVTKDGGTLCAECVQENLSQCADPADAGSEYAQWQVVGWYHEGDTDELDACDHCNRQPDVQSNG